MPDKLTDIGVMAFTGCTGIKSISLPNSLVKAYSNIFWGCTNLQSVDIGSNLKAISGNIFRECPNLTKVTVSASNPYMIVEDDIVYTSDKKTLIYYPSGRSGSRFRVPDGVTKIGECAFTYMGELKELRIAASVTKMEEYAVFHNEQLSKILFYGNAPEVEKEKRDYGTSSGKECYKVTNGSIAKNQTTKGANKYDNSNLIIYTVAGATGFDAGWKSLPDMSSESDEDVTYIWGENFSFLKWEPSKTDVYKGNFSKLNWMYRDDIGELSFTGSGKTTDFTAGNLPTWSETKDGKLVSHLGDVQLVDTTGAESVELGNYALYKATGLVRINSGKELKKIGNYTFAGCEKLQMPLISKVQYIGSNAFFTDTAITDELDIRGAVSIGKAAFKNCNIMSGILFGKNLESMGEEAFSGCTALSDIMLVGNIDKISKNCFNGCESLRTINIPKTITALESGCFKGASVLEKVYFYGDYIENMAKDSFSGCSSDIKIYYRAGNDSWSTNVPDGKWNGITVKALDKFFTEKKDTYSFENTAESFGYNEKYYIPRQRYVTALQSVVKGTYYYSLSSEWSGSCFGMSASATEFYEGTKFNAGDYTDGAKSLYDVTKPERADADLTKLIEIYQVSQFNDKVSDEIAANRGKYGKLIKKVEEFERSGGIGVDENAEPVIMCLYGGYSGHTVIPVSVDYDDDGNYEMQVYDCNSPGEFANLTINEDFSGINFTSDKVSYSSASFVNYSTVRDVLKNADFTGKGFSADNSANSEDNTEKIMISVKSENVKIENTSGRDVSEIKGAYEQHSLSGSDSFSGLRSFVLPAGEYNVTDTEETAANSRRMKSAKGLSTKGAAADGDITYYVATEETYLKINTTDENAKVAVTSVEGSGQDSVNIASDSSNAKTEILLMNDDGKESTISAVASDVTVEKTLDDKLVLKLSKDADEVKVNDKYVEVKNQTVTDIEFEDKTGCDEKNTHKLTVNAGDGISEVSGSGFYAEGEQVTLTATVSDGYEWMGWSDGNTDRVRTVTMGAEDVTYTALATMKGALATKEPQDNNTAGNGSNSNGGTDKDTTGENNTAGTGKDNTSGTDKDGTASVTKEPGSTDVPQATKTPDNTKVPAQTTKPDNTKTPTVTGSPNTPSSNADTVKKGKIVKYGNTKYKVTNTVGKTGTVSFIGCVKKTVKKVTVPKQIKLNNKIYKVTAVEDNAFKNVKKLDSVTISENITKIGKNVFSGCKKLNSIIIKTKSLKSVGKNAFKGTKTKIKVSLPKKKYKTYKKLLTEKGKLSKKAVIKKI